MKIILCFVLIFGTAFAEEQTVHTPKEVETKFDPYSNDGMKKFDPHSEQDGKEVTLPEPKPVTEDEKEKKGLIDGMIDSAKDASASGKK